MTITFDLAILSDQEDDGDLTNVNDNDVSTFRFLQDLQFIDSRGSAWTRRGVRRSMLTWGRDMALPVHRMDGEGEEDGVGVGVVVVEEWLWGREERMK